MELRGISVSQCFAEKLQHLKKQCGAFWIRKRKLWKMNWSKILKLNIPWRTCLEKIDSCKAFYMLLIQQICGFKKKNRPSGLNFIESKGYFSQKHKFYGFKSEVLVIPSVYCINSSNHVPAGMANITLFRKNVALHQSDLQKFNRNQRMTTLRSLNLSIQINGLYL